MLNLIRSMTMMSPRVLLPLALVCAIAPSHLRAADDAPAADAAGQNQPRLRILFLGDDGHHKPEDRAEQLIPAMRKRGIEITYTENVNHLNPAMLNQYDGLIIYANINVITPAQEKALLDYVEGGGGFIPLHSASYCFLNSPKYVALVGAQFRRHGTGVFSVTPVQPEHPVLDGFKGFESWDETYEHTKHNEEGRTVLQVREEGGRKEPWTWVRTQGKGRVFYTAWGHDQRTFGNEGFQELVERGIRWATEPRVKQRLARDEKPFRYIRAGDAIPNYTPGAQWGTQDQPYDTMQAPLPPEASRKRIVTPPSLKASLFAADPDIGPALAMNWDARGRLWLCESVDYPNELKAPGEGRDRIRIVEDTDGDGKADKFTVFAETLSIPTAITFHRGGAIVQDGTQTVYLKDTDGDDRADVRKVLITGWAMGDTHGGVSNFRYGLDNWVWGMQGYNNSRPTFNGKQSQAFRMGFFRFKLDQSDPPSVTDVEFIRSTNNNTWGLGISEEGLIFGSTANRNPSVYMPIANRYYEAVTGFSPRTLGTIANHHYFYPVSDRVRQVDHHGGYTAGAGHALYTARTLPREYWNRTAFVNGPTGKLTGVYVLRPNGADFSSTLDWNIVASDDEWFAPIASDVGPDGGVWVLDWYNYIIQHNPTPRGFKTGKGNAYETTLRDKKHTRVYRVTPDDGQRAEALRLSRRLLGDEPHKADANTLVAALKSDNMFWRLRGQRLLIERGKRDVVPALLELLRDQTTDEIGLNVGAMHALWTLHGLGAIEEKDAVGAIDGEDSAVSATVLRALRHPSAGVRRNAVQVLPREAASVDAILAAGLLDDADAQVRLATLLALAEMPASPQAGAAVFAMLRRPINAEDRWLPDAATAAAAKHDAGFLQAVLASTERKGGGNDGGGDDGRDARPTAENNLIRNGSLDEVRNGRPTSWRPVTYSGGATFEVSDEGRGENSKCVTIISQNGADASWTFDAVVKPNTRYRVSAWVKTRGLDKNTGYGAQINLHQLQREGKTDPVTGDTDWTRISSEFNSGGNRSLAVNLLFGGWGQSKGQAWFDDVELIELGPGGPAAGARTVALPGRAGEVVTIVTRHFAARAPVDSVVGTLSSLKGADEQLAAFVLDGLSSGWPQGKAPTLSDADRAELAALMDALPQQHRDKLVTLADKWGNREIFSADIAGVVKGLLATLSDGDADDEKRIDAARRLIRLDDKPQHIHGVLMQIKPWSSSRLATGLIEAVGASRSSAVGDALAARWRDLTPVARRTAVAVLLRRPVWTKSLLDAIEAKKIARVDLSASDWQLLQISKDEKIAKRAAELSQSKGQADRQAVLEKMLPMLKAEGDPKLGKKLFNEVCARCHTFKGEGGKVGPDLTGIGSHPPDEILAEIVDPNRSLEANYRLWTIETADFETLSGRLDGETRTSVELLDLNGKRHVIQRDNIDSMRASSLSIMPPGLIDHYTAEQVASLMAYLRSGKH